VADFVQTMKNWRRMCQYMEKLHPDDSCCGCPLEGYGCPAIYEDNNHVDYDDVEKNVTTWAAEHPEPVYQLWGEWFEEHGDLIRGWHNATNVQWMAHTFSRLLCTPIPADIAQKLGIEAKEDT